MAALVFTFAAEPQAFAQLKLSYAAEASSTAGLWLTFVATDLPKRGLIFEFATRAPIAALLPRGQKCRWPF